ncbi:alpha-L-rhamnosidase [Adhaeribacter arboris]|uniref:alpha-L-rhamnosidase n=1 Tax=Adhaeribacter arboris TaxID=2072846 RepID=A0A2T2YIK7_9BACT|nr:family 78 glycoside hydrolase catalytic domain [Adhaeribacter arboris]PSR55340.1 alpha-L-rhamnosidase [Adhaeribacter arboris]
MIKFLLPILLLLAFSCQSLSQKGSSLRLVSLKCEYQANPIGVEATAPRFSWEIQSNQRGVLQTTYHLLVADNAEALNKNTGTIWDSGKVSSDKSIQVEYAGKELLPTKLYFWKIKIQDNQGNESNWSEPATFQMGLLSQQDWAGARWIAYEELPPSERIVPALPEMGDPQRLPNKNILPLLRKEFTVKNPVKRATMYISGLGHFEMSLNGKKVGDHFLDPGWTDYSEQALYVTFDVANQIKPGANAVGVMLGNGFYHVPGERYRKITGTFGYPKMICRLLVEYTDGTQENLVSDASWKTAPGPVTFTGIYGGEDYDATREQPGWNTTNFKENSPWKPVVLVEGPPQLNSQQADPLRIFENFSPKKITQPQPGVWIYDLGQNASGIPQLSVKGKKGATVKITPGELLDKNLVTQQASGGPHFYQYTLKGNGTETWHPQFTYYGFRYLQIEGGVPEGEPNPQNLPVIVGAIGLHTRNAAPRVGQFTSSNELFNQTEKLIDWAIRSNMASVLTDCPHREKLGWLEEAHLVGSSIRYHYDIARLSKKVIRDMQVAQTAEGLIPDIAPEFVEFAGGFRDSPEWGSNGIIMPWYVYQWYGDQQVLADSYPMMQRYVAYLEKKSNNHLLTHGLGDWYDIGPKHPGESQLTPRGVSATAIYYYDLTLMSKIAALLNKPDDVTRYNQLATQVKQAFNKTFFNNQTKQYATGSQTANAMAVFMNLVEPQNKDAVVANIVKDIRHRNNSLTAGDIGFRYLLRVLDNENRSDVIFDMNSRSDVPGYGYQLAHGATSLTESWQAYGFVSNNHFMLGHILEWFYSGLGGIRPNEKAVAFKNIDIRPELVGDVTFVKASHYSPYGLISSDWQKSNGKFNLTVQIPANTTATIYLPAPSASTVITESGKPVKNNKEIKNIRYQNSRAVLEVGSGTYAFAVEM